MTLPQLQKTIHSFIDHPDQLGLQLFFVIKSGQDFELLEPALDSKELEPALKKDFLEEIGQQFFAQGENDDLELQDLNTAEATDRRTIYHIVAGEIPMAASLLKGMQDETHIKKYDPKNHDFTSIWGIVAKIGHDGHHLYLFKRNYPVNVVKKGIAYPLFFAQGALQLEKKELLKISSKFEWLSHKKDLFILNKNEFESSFEYVYAVETKANAAIDLILDAKIISDGTKLYDLSKQRNAVKKIISISGSNPVLKKSPRQIVTFAKKYGFPLQLSEDKKTIELHNQKEARNLLKLFNDDLLLSELSDTKYDSRGKQKLNL